MHWLLEKSSKEITLERKRKTALDLVRNFKVYSSYIPSGQIHADTKHDLENAIRESEMFYDELDKIFKNDYPQEYIALKNEFKANIAQSRKLASMPRQALNETPAHEFFPYYGRFDDSIKEQCERAYSHLALNDLTFTTELIGSGGFADIYKAMHKDGREFALKLYRHAMMLPAHKRQDRFHEIEQIKRRIKEHDDITRAEPFLAWQIIPDYGQWYVMDYLEGRNAFSYIDDVELKKHLTPRLAHNIISTYAKGLWLLHRKGMCFSDNSLSNIIIGKDKIGIIDYDFITKATEQATASDSGRKNNDNEFYNIMTLAFASKEQLRGEPMSLASDLEGFSLIIDAIYNKKLLRPSDMRVSDKEAMKAAARNDSYKYPKNRLHKIPPPLHELMLAVMNYPRSKNTPKIEDFIEAISRA